MLKILGKIDIANRLIVPFVRENLESFRSYIDTMVCDICRTNHYRTSLWIVEIDGERKTAGTRCLKSMFGESEFNRAYSEAKEAYSYRINCPYELKEVINKAYSLIKKNGFVSKAKARMDCTIPTSTYLINQFEDVESTEDVADQVIAYTKSINDYSTYAVNCKEIVGQQYIGVASFAFIPAIVNSWIKHELWLKLKQQNCEKTEFYGEVSTRYTESVNATFIKEENDSYYTLNSRRLYFKVNNSIFMWRTSTGYHFEENEEVEIKKFTVKSHFQSKLGKITAVTRLTL